MATEVKIEVHKRDLSNKKSEMKALRNEHKIPGIYYSHNSKNSTPLYITNEAIQEAQKSGAKIFNISVGNKKRNIIFKTIQYHPVTDQIIHVDLYGVDMKRAVTVKVSIALQGNAKGIIEDGGVLVQSLNEIEIDCLPLDIPDTINVDVSHLGIGDSIKLEEITLDEKFVLKTDIKQTIASVTHPMKEEELQPVVEEEEEEMFAEGEEGEEVASDADKDDQDKDNAESKSKKEEGK